MQVSLCPNIPDQEERAIKLLTRLLAKPWRFADKVGILTSTTIHNLSSVETIDDVASISPTVCEYLLEETERVWDEKRAEKSRRFVAKAHNRTEYLPTGRLEMRDATSKQGDEIHRWHGTIALECSGLLPRMVENIYGSPSQPVAISIVNMLSPSMELGLKHAPINVVHWENMLGLGMAVSGERVAWEMNSPAWSLLLKCFPSAIDARAYNHSLKAPLNQGGYLPDVSVTFRNLTSFQAIGQVKTPKGMAYVKSLSLEELSRLALQGIHKRHHKSMSEDMENLHSDVQGCTDWDEMENVLAPWGLHHLLRKSMVCKEVPMGDDGSGRYHPNAPEMADLIARYGLVPYQLRAVDAQHGMFAKGIIVPDERSVDSEGNPCITCSWKQVKGRWKKLAAQRASEGAVATKRMHIGILRAWDRKRYMVGCFELLENIGVVPEQGESQESIRAREAQVREDLFSLVDEAMQDLGKDGINGLLASIAKDDKVLSLVIKLLAKAESRGIHIDPMSIDRVKQALDQKLQRRLWAIAQGAGIEGRQLVIVNDGGLKRGEVVCSHYKVGQELAVWRFPMVLAQGLQVHKVVSPRPHQMVAQKGLEQLCFMNPEDVLDMQGDDDGDIVAATTDPRVIRLFREKIDYRRFAIEPEGEKLNMETQSPEGLAYLRQTPMGPVGVMTINRSKLLAVGDTMGALACSVLIQECIDKAKRKVRWSDWEMASDMGNWRQGTDGVWRLHWEGSANYLDQRKDGEEHDELPLQMVLKWVNSRLRKFGCVSQSTGNLQELEPGLYADTVGKTTPLGWRVQEAEEEDALTGEVRILKVNKRIAPSHWQRSREKQGGYEGGNLVHEAHDRALVRWGEIEAEFVSSEQSGDVSELLLRLLREEGATIDRPNMSWFEYLDVRALSGIGEFSEAMKKALSQDKTDEEGGDNGTRYADINAAYELLHQRLREYVEMRGVQGLVDIWCMETSPCYRVSSGGETWYTFDRSEIPAGAKFTKVNNPNHAINAVCYPGSPVMELLGIQGEDVCSFLDSKKLETIIKVCTSKDNAFQTLADMVWSKSVGRHEKEMGIPVSECEHCKSVIQTELVRHFRNLKGRTEKQFLGRIVGALNSNGNTELPVGDASALGINMAQLMQFSDQELQELHNDLMDSPRREDRATCKLIEKILSGQM